MPFMAWKGDSIFKRCCTTITRVLYFKKYQTAREIIPMITKIIQRIYAILRRAIHLAFFSGVSKNRPRTGSSSIDILLFLFFHKGLNSFSTEEILTFSFLELHLNIFPSRIKFWNQIIFKHIHSSFCFFNLYSK